jgi:hypothetical protein
MAKTKDDISQAVEAVETLERLGRKSFVPEYQAPRDHAIAMGLIAGTGGHIDALQVAADILEDNNHHTLAGLVQHIHDGHYKRKGNTFTITLPAYYV